MYHYTTTFGGAPKERGKRRRLGVVTKGPREVRTGKCEDRC